MRVLLGYSRCRHTRMAFERAGHEVWTCDLLTADHPRHLQCDVWEVLGDIWDLAVLHPMCTYLTTAAAWAFFDPDFERYPEVGYHQKIDPTTLTGKARRDARELALDNFRRLLALPYPKAIENPAHSFISKAIRRPDQAIHPYQFGDDASKSTGLWLDRVKPQVPTKMVPPRLVEYRGRIVRRWANQTPQGGHKETPSADRWLKRSATYPGIAAAMGSQWGRGADREFSGGAKHGPHAAAT